jgi:hypothetical protein
MSYSTWRNSESESELLYSWRFTANQFVLAPSPLRLKGGILFLNWIFAIIVLIASSLTRGWFCHLQMLLALASAFILESESRGTREGILLSQNRDFPFCRLLRLAGLRWKYSTPPPHGKVRVSTCNCPRTNRKEVDDSYNSPIVSVFICCRGDMFTCAFYFCCNVCILCAGTSRSVCYERRSVGQTILE